jgi:hypothetical protein
MNSAFPGDDSDEERDDAYRRDRDARLHSDLPCAGNLDSWHERAMAAKESMGESDDQPRDYGFSVEDSPEIGDGRDAAEKPTSAPEDCPGYRASTEVNATDYTVVVIQDLADRTAWIESTIAYDLGRWC